MKKFLPLIVLFLVSCASSQLQPIGNEVVFQPPKGWDVAGVPTENLFDGNGFENVRHKEAIVYAKGLNKIVVSAIYSDKSFDYGNVYKHAGSQETIVNTRKYDRNNAVSVEFGESLYDDGAYVSLNNFGVYYKAPQGSAVVSVSYIGISEKSEQDSISGISDYNQTVESIRFK